MQLKKEKGGHNYWDKMLEKENKRFVEGTPFRSQLSGVIKICEDLYIWIKRCV